MRAPARTLLGYTFAGLLAVPAFPPRAEAAPRDGERRAPVVEESPAERRAVRGIPVEGGNETPELREVRRFEDETFPRARDLPPRSRTDDGDQPLPPGLEGRWGGSGDIPSELRSPETARSPARAAPQPDSEWLRSLALPSLPVRWEPQVVRFLDFWKSDPRGRAIMTSWMRRLERFRPVFERALERQGVPKDLVFVAMIESGFDPGAVSNKAAGGMWQFLPGVARAYGLEVSYWVDARRDPERAADAAARYFKDLYVRFGSWHLAFAAYHAGYGAILTSIARFNTNDFWELCRHEAGLPWETTLYVPKILAAAIVGHNRAAFGYADVPSDPPWVYERVEVAPGTPLETVARAAGVSAEVLESLNPELIRRRTPPDRGPTQVRIPVGTAAIYAEAGERLRAAGEKVDTVVLRFGESIDDVARARGISSRELRRLNGLKDSAELRGGTTILVPVRSVAPPASDGANGEGETGPDDAILVAVPERTFSYPGRERVFYRTRDGDSLDELAGVFHVAADDIVEWNNLDADAKLQPRLVLQLFVRKDFDKSGIALLDPAKVRVVTLGSEEFFALDTARRGKTRLFYTARAGDTLSKIARRYGLEPGDLARINRLSAASDLDAGQRIVVYSPTPELPREVVVGRAAPHRRPKEPVASGKGSAKKPTAVAGTSPTGKAGSGSKTAGKPAAPAKSGKGSAGGGAGKASSAKNGPKPQGSSAKR